VYNKNVDKERSQCSGFCYSSGLLMSSHFGRLLVSGFFGFCSMSSVTVFLEQYFLILLLACLLVF
jgi:hypothetical protein